MDLSAVVLAGGHSRRLGHDKALLHLDGEWLLATIVTGLRSLSSDVLVVADGQQKLGGLRVPVVPDLVPGRGALGGIYSGLVAMKNRYGVFVACDMPFINRGLLCHLMTLARSWDAVIPRIGTNVEPLHAVYAKTCIPAIAKCLAEGQRRTVSFFPRVRVLYVEGAEIERFDPQRLSFFNINTPDDLQQALAIRRTGRRQARPQV